ncbi:MAG: hypothetical protein K6U74_03105 [Firmicutes bacterium]|nr:hypothetical protein [Bacillota bacterium]
MLFPPCTKQVFCADASGEIKARVRVQTAVRAIRSGRARKISDNLIQYRDRWDDTPALTPGDNEIVLLGTISRCTPKPGWLRTDDPATARNIFRHNNFVVALALPNLHGRGPANV